MVRRSHLVFFYFKEKFCVSARVGKSLARYLSSSVYTAFRPCRKKVYLRLYLTQIVHSNGKILFLAPNNCASLTFFKEKLSVSARVSKSLAWTVFTCVDKCYLSVVFAAWRWDWSVYPRFHLTKKQYIFDWMAKIISVLINVQSVNFLSKWSIAKC